MPNITVSVDDEEFIRQVKATVALKGKSVSELVREYLKELVEREQQRSSARKRARKLMDKGFELGGKPLSRNEIHE